MRRSTKLFIAITVLIAAVLLYLTPIFIPQAKEEELKTAWKLDVRFEPVMPEQEAAKLYKGWKKAVKHAMHWLEDED